MDLSSYNGNSDHVIKIESSNCDAIYFFDGCTVYDVYDTIMIHGYRFEVIVDNIHRYKGSDPLSEKVDVHRPIYFMLNHKNKHDLHVSIKIDTDHEDDIVQPLSLNDVINRLTDIRDRCPGVDRNITMGTGRASITKVQFERGNVTLL